MSTPSLKAGYNDAARRPCVDDLFDDVRLDQWLIARRNECSLAVGPQGAQAGLNRREHFAAGVIGVVSKPHCTRAKRALDLILLMAGDDDRIADSTCQDDADDLLDDRQRPKGQQELVGPHAARKASRQDDCPDSFSRHVF